MAEFRIARDRDAYFAIRGFRYQADSTILRWLELDAGHELELECGEDIDVVARELTPPYEEVSRRLEQVKHRKSTVTLWSAAAVGVIANAVTHRTQNPTLPMVIRFCTNATPATERPSPFPDRLPGILVWEGLRNPEQRNQQRLERLSGIRFLLTRARMPKDFNQSTWREFMTFVSTASDEDLLTFIEAIEWSTGQADVDETARIVEQVLINKGYGRDPRHALDLHGRLFLHVMNVLSRQGRKKLNASDLAELTTLPSLGKEDQAALAFVMSEVFQLAGRVAHLERYAQVHDQAIAGLEEKVRLQADKEGVAARLSADLPLVSLEVPPKVLHLCKRSRTIAAILQRIKNATWTAIYGSVGTGKTQLSTLLAESLGRPIRHLSLRDLGSSQALLRIHTVLAQLAGGHVPPVSLESVCATVAALAAGSVFVLDDLPRMDDDSNLARTIATIVTVFRQHDVLLLSNSHHAVPHGTVEYLPTGSVASLPAPPFTTSETVELFRAYGASDAFCNSEEVSLINVHTQGNAALLAGYAHSLSGNNWTLTAAETLRLKEHVHAQEVIDQAVRRLLATVQDTDTREILYRAGLILGQFGRSEVDAVAAAARPIDRPRERLSALTGLWIEERAQQKMLVSPLVKPLSTTELDHETRRDIYSSLAGRLVKRHAISIFDVGEAVFYLDQAREYQRLGLLLLNAINSAAALPEAQAELLLIISGTHRSLPNEMDLSLRIFLRAQQIMLAHRTNRPIDYLLGDLDHMCLEARENDDWAVYAGSAMVLSCAAQHDFVRSLAFCERTLGLHAKVMGLLTVTTTPDDASALHPPIAAADMFWITVAGLRTSDDLVVWIDLLKRLPKDTLMEIFAHEHAPFGSVVAVDNIWLTFTPGTCKDAESRRILDVLEYTSAFAASRGIETLWAAAIRAKIIIHAEFRNDIEASLDTAERGMQDGLLGPRSQFLLADAIGRQLLYKDRRREALGWLKQAIEADTDCYPCIRARTPVEASRAIGDEDPGAAVAFAADAVAVARSHPGEILEVETASLLGELGIANALAADLLAAFDAFNEAANVFLSCRDGSTRWKARFAAFLHALGYLANLADHGVPPESGRDGEAYLAPKRGLLLNPPDGLAVWYQEQNYDATFPMFFPAMALFAEGVGRYDASIEWAFRGLDDARKARMPLAVWPLGERIIPALLSSGRIGEAIDTAIESCAALMVATEAGKRGMPATAVDVDVSESLGAKPNERWDTIESWAAYHSVLPAAMQIGRWMQNDRERALRCANDLTRSCREVATVASNARLWERLADVVRSIFIAPMNPRELHDRANNAENEGVRAVAILSYLGCTLVPEASVQNSPVYHAIVFRRLFQTIGHRSMAYVKVGLPFLADHWRFTFKNQRFRFSTPNIVESDLVSAFDQPVEKRAQAILNAVIRGLRVRFPGTIKEVSDWLVDV
jgi:hypothetical protein